MDRVVGADRYATAAELSARSFRRGVERVFVASGEDFPDALGAAAVAGGVRAPVLLTRSGSIPEVVQAELVRLLPREIVVVGGSGAVSAGVVDRLSGFTGGRVVRAGGADRFATSVALSRLMFPRGAERVFVATGSDFPDALSGAVAAGTRRAPVLVVPAGAVPEVVMQELVRLAPRSITVLGGTGVVSDEVVERLAQVAPVQRWAGADRYATSAVVSSMDPRVIGRVLVATGTGFADALAGAVVAAAGDATLVLSQQGCVPAPVLSELQRLRPAQVTLLGGPGALGASVESLTPCGAAG